MKIHYFGHSAYLIETGEHRLLVDPFLSGNPQCKQDPASIKCDYILLTHGHADHFGDTEVIAKSNDATVVATFELAHYCETLGLRVHPMHIGGETEFPFGRLKMTIAHHASSMVVDEKSPYVYLGNPCGFLIKAEGKTVYHAGDTGLFLDMQLIGEMESIDLAMLPIGNNFTMGIKDATKAVEFLKAKKAMPMHYNTFPPIEVDPNLFAESVRGLGVEGIVLEYGAAYEFK